MSGFQTQSNDHLIRSNLWSSKIKEVLEDELMGTKYVDMITDFPDGDTINIPSIGQAEIRDYVEGSQVSYTSMDTGNFTFSIDQYKSSATDITEKMKQDSFYMSRLVASFVPKQARAIAKAMEAKILSVGPDGQTNLFRYTPNNFSGSMGDNTTNLSLLESVIEPMGNFTFSNEYAHTTLDPETPVNIRVYSQADAYGKTTKASMELVGQQFDNLGGEGGRAGGWVLNLIEWRRETAKVVQSGRLAGAADAQF